MLFILTSILGINNSNFKLQKKKDRRQYFLKSKSKLTYFTLNKHF